MRIEEVSFAVHGLAIGQLRAGVWTATGEREAKQFRNGIWHDEWEDVSIHWAAFCEGRIVASARLTLGQRGDSMPYAAHLPEFSGMAGVLSRMVVDSASRGNGIAHQLDLLRIRKAKQMGASSLFGFFGGHRIAAMTQLGFKAIYSWTAEQNFEFDGRYAPVSLMSLSIPR